ncbi:MAG: DNA repair protein RadA [Chloroflexi bacterium]|nr:MAG: DNA repair protein RadA [Chloroflexota bacterium]
MSHPADTTNGHVSVDPDLLAELLDEAKAGMPEPEPRTISARELLNKEFAPVRWAVPDLITEGLTLLSGRPKMGKSWICLDIAIAVASGGLVMGTLSVDAGHVLYLALEDGQRRLQDRLKKLLPYGVTAPDNLKFATQWERLHEGGVQTIEAWLDQHPDARLAIVDTLAKVRPPAKANGNTYQEDYNCLQPLADMARKRNISILVVTHSRKAAADDVMDDISGSTGLTAGVDGMLVLRRGRGEAEAELHATNRDAQDQELALLWDASMTRWSIAGKAEQYRLHGERRKIVDLVTASKDGLTPKEIAIQADKNESTTRVLLSKMLADGLLRKVGDRYIVPSISSA